MGKINDFKAPIILHDDTVCSCGMHKGIGEWTPEVRAITYGWMRDGKTVALSDLQSKFLESWEKAHRPIVYEDYRQMREDAKQRNAQAIAYGDKFSWETKKSKKYDYAA